MKAADVMVSNVITVHQDTPVAKIAEVLLANRISAVPVVNEKDIVVGIVSEGDLLHRVEAGTLVDNAASQVVLRRCGFEPYGTAAQYLFIAGAWQDHLLFQRVLHDHPA